MNKKLIHKDTKLIHKDIKERISNLKTQLLYEFPFFGVFLLNTDIIEETTFPTAATDGMRIFYNPSFFDQLSDLEVKGVLIHEVFHMVYSHCQKLRRGIREPQKWNVACFPAGTILPGSYKPIEEYRDGDSVIGMSGQKQTIVQTMKRSFNGKMIKVKASGIMPFEATDEHPIFVASRKKGYPIKLTNPVWKTAGELRAKEDYLVIPIPIGIYDLQKIDLLSYLNREKIKNHDQCHNIASCVKDGIILDEDFAWFMGLYAAEGSRTTSKNSGIQFSLNINETEYETKIRNMGNKLGYSVITYKHEEKHSMSIKIASTLLCKFFIEHMGSGAKNKKIPDFILYHKNIKILNAFLDGLLCGDGCQVKKPTKQLGTSSMVLALQTQLAIIRLGYYGNLRKNIIKSRMLRDQQLPESILYVVDWIKSTGSTRIMNNIEIVSFQNRWKKQDNFIFVPITKITNRDFNGDVYNLTTPDHTFAVNNVLVHNCDYAINWEIDEMKKEDIKLPNNIVIDGKPFKVFLDKKYKSMYVEQIYEALVADPNFSGDDQGFDIHIDMPDGEEGKEVINDRILTSYEISKKDMRGKMPAGILRAIDEIRRSRVPWNRVFHRYLGSALAREDYSYTRPNRRFISQELYLPSLFNRKVGLVAIAVDTSGSIGEKELGAFTNELRKVSAMISEVIVMSCDADVHTFEIVRDMTNFNKAIKFKGGGGTDFRPPFELLKKKRIVPEVMLYLSDGEGTFPEKKGINYPVIWLLTTTKIAPFGVTIQMKL